jgi:hypothetical protein
MKSVDQRFWEKVDKTDDCWLWKGGLFNTGYGAFLLEKKMTTAHRVSLEWSLCRPIGEGLVARHKCRNRNCVRPEHLEEGTRADNEADKLRDGTSNRGENCGTSKLTKEQIMDIRNDPRKLSEIAASYGIRHQHVSRIKTGKTWSWLTG